MVTIYGDVLSGNCYKVKLTCELLDITYKWQAIDILKGETQTESFLQLNPNGKTPCVQFEDGFVLSESNAIINYLARDSFLYPNEPQQQALIQQWQFFEQYSHEPYIAVARFINTYLGLPPERAEEYKQKQQGGHKALSLLNTQLNKTAYLTGEAITTADISLFAYTHVADEGGFELERYPAIMAWIERVASHPKFIKLG